MKAGSDGDVDESRVFEANSMSLDKSRQSENGKAYVRPPHPDDSQSHLRRESRRNKRESSKGKQTKKQISGEEIPGFSDPKASKMTR